MTLLTPGAPWVSPTALGERRRRRFSALAADGPNLLKTSSVRRKHTFIPHPQNTSSYDIFASI